jgi:hypothetical protein
LMWYDTFRQTVPPTSQPLIGQRAQFTVSTKVSGGSPTLGQEPREEIPVSALTEILKDRVPYRY